MTESHQDKVVYFALGIAATVAVFAFLDYAKWNKKWPYNTITP